MKIIVAGSRGILDIDTVTAAIASSGFEVTGVVSGHAHGVDKLGEYWASCRAIPVTLFPAEWKKHGKSAGAIRNVTMAHNADALIAIWDGSSRGTKHMIDAMTRLKKPVYVHDTSKGTEGKE